MEIIYFLIISLILFFLIYFFIGLNEKFFSDSICKKIESEDGEENEFTIKIKSVKNCPILKSIINSYRKTDANEKILNRLPFINFQNKIISKFFNIDTATNIEYIEKKENFINIQVENATTFESEYPRIQIITSKMDDTFTEEQYYIEYNNDKKIPNLYNLFNIKRNYQLNDILNFCELAFTLNTVQFIHISSLTAYNDHMIYTYNTYYSTNYQIPERIIQQAINEGKEYTRMYKNDTGNKRFTTENVIIYFTNFLPKKFSHFINEDDISKLVIPSKKNNLTLCDNIETRKTDINKKLF